jgi:hypothetical protein
MSKMKIDCITEYKKILDNAKTSNVIKEKWLVDSTDRFKITKHKDGNYPAIITISGFRTEGLDNRKDWNDSIMGNFPDREWFHLEWNSNRFPFDKKLMTNMPEINELEEKKKKFANYIKTSVLYFAPYGKVIYLLLNNYWHVAVRNSRQTGIYLADVLSACEKKDFILVGHSLGARVIYNCLEHLDEKKLNTNIVEVHFLGGAVSNNKNQWLSVSHKVKNNIYNYFSDNDKVLKIFYRIGMLTMSPIGLTKIENGKVINNDTTQIVKGHTEYIQKFHILGSPFT